VGTFQFLILGYRMGQKNKNQQDPLFQFLILGYPVYPEP